jgi:outer membrane protein TolC
MRWNFAVMGLALAIAGVVGCKQQCFLTECDVNHYQNIGLPPALDCKPKDILTPFVPDVPTPATVLNPEREIRNLTLAEAIAIALERGSTGIVSFTTNAEQEFGIALGRVNDTLITAGPAGLTPTLGGDDAIRVLALDPALAAADIDASLSKFDVHWVTSMTWNTTDRPVGTALDVFQSQGRVNAINLNDATYSSSMVKPLPTGGVAGITFRTDYELSNLSPRVNPSYRPALVFGFEQPLLQGFGVEINQLRSNHPGVAQGGVSNLNPFQTGSVRGVPGILITRIRFDLQRAEFERNVSAMLLNVEAAYWNLFNAYWGLYSQEQALRQAYEAWKINRARFEAGRIPIQDYAQTRVQYELFRGQRIQALGAVLEAERNLRGLIGLPAEDGTRLVPVDTPNLAPYQPDWATAMHEALTLRPELIVARQELRFRQLDIINQKNLLLPDVRFTSSYDVNGIGSRLDGPEGALSSLASNTFNNWALGIRADIPLGFRDAHSAVRVARLNLLRTYYALQDQEAKTLRFLALQYRNLFEFQEQIKAQRAQRQAAAQQLEARFKEFLAGRGTLDILLEAQRFWATALRAEYDAISSYNNCLACFEWAKGTLLQHDNVVITEGPLPQCAQVRATEHERERSKAFALRERANPILAPGCCAEKGDPGLPQLPEDRPASVPAALEGLKATPAPPETLPLPTPGTPPKPPTGDPGKAAAPGGAAPEKAPNLPPAPEVGKPGPDKLPPPPPSGGASNLP